MPGKTLTINGGGVITLDGGSSTQLLLITSSAGTTLEHLTLAHGQAPNATPTGGALLVSGSDLTLTGDTFTNNNATGDAAHDAKGGALYMTGETLTVQTSTFKHNGASDTTIGRSAYGGALYYTGGGTVTITGSTFNDNTAQAQAVAYGGQSRRSPAPPSATARSPATPRPSRAAPVPRRHLAARSTA
jgi:hypothetical protein